MSAGPQLVKGYGSIIAWEPIIAISGKKFHFSPAELSRPLGIAIVIGKYRNHFFSLGWVAPSKSSVAHNSKDRTTEINFKIAKVDNHTDKPCLGIDELKIIMSAAGIVDERVAHPRCETEIGGIGHNRAVPVPTGVYKLELSAF